LARLRERSILIALVAALVTSAAVQGCGPSSSGSSNAPPSPPPSGPVGTWSSRFLQAEPYGSLLVEVAYVSSEQPTSSALSLLQQRLSQHCNKPGGVTVVLGSSITATQSVYSLQDCVNLENQYRKNYASGSQAVLFFLYLNGGSTLDTSTSRTLALTFDGTSTAVFKDSVKASAFSSVTPADVEASVDVHEAGHSLGIVNLGAPLTSSHEDLAHPHHCTNDLCVMFWAFEHQVLTQLLQSGHQLPNDYDAACVADLQAGGGK
jgi:hypothetical protein